jgi:hypothetical protein
MDNPQLSLRDPNHVMMYPGLPSWAKFNQSCPD